MRERVLYLGLELPASRSESVDFTHFPIIETLSLMPSDEVQKCLKSLNLFTDLIFTSKVAVRLLSTYLSRVTSKRVIAVGQATAHALRQLGFTAIETAANETAEGLIELMKAKPHSFYDEAFFFWPHSALSRPLIVDFLKAQGWKYSSCNLYTTLTSQANPLPNPHAFERICFTSPSTVDAFLERYGSFPQGPILEAIGPITAKHLKQIRDRRDCVPLLH